MRLAPTLALFGLAATAAAGPPRFFITGDGTLAVLNAHTGERVSVRYRRSDGTYDAEALARLNRVFRSGGDGVTIEVSVRLIEVLSHVQGLAGGKPLRLLSGYRSPVYNQSLRERGVKAAGGSLHTEGLAADVGFPAAQLLPLWRKVRGLDCCGAGYYAKDGFLHIDVGRPRFWEPKTSRVDENISAGNARLFARTEFDRYGAGEEIVLRLHALTAPPVRIAPAAQAVPEGSDPLAVQLRAELAERDGCLEVPVTGTRLRVAGPPRLPRARLRLRTCEPRAERTPETLESNLIEVR